MLYFRRVVPEHARERVGRYAWVKSLDTPSVDVARHLIPRHLADYERAVGSHPELQQPAVIAKSLMGLPPPDQIEEAVRVWFAERMSRFDNGPPANYEAAQSLSADIVAVSEDASQALPMWSTDAGLTTRWIAEAVCERQGWAFDPTAPSVRKLIRLLARGQVEAAAQMQRELNGQPRRIDDETFSPEQYKLDAERQRLRPSALPISLDSLFDGYCAERQPSPATVKAWTRFVKSFKDFLAHDDASRISPADVVRWKEYLLTPTATGFQRSQKTVGETYLAAIKTVLGWAVENHKIAVNPASGVTVRSPKERRPRSKGLNDAEAVIILRATLLPCPQRMSLERKFARRWVPWLCAYTGARVNEMTQLRSEDVRKQDGVWTVLITPEAGSVKNGAARTVALHPHLIDQGFAKAIEGKDGPLFYDPARSRGGREGNPQYKKTGEYLASWVRELGVNHPAVAPNHGWRHRFKTLAREAGMSDEIRDAIQGHAPRTEGEHYGDVSPLVMDRAIRLLPRYEL